MDHPIGCFWIGNREIPLTAEQINQRAAKLMEGIPMTVRCKFVCSHKEGQNVAFHPVYSGSEENKQFFAATPGGQFQLYIVNPSVLDQFEIGKEYYIDISAA